MYKCIKDKRNNYSGSLATCVLWIHWDHSKLSRSPDCTGQFYDKAQFWTITKCMDYAGSYTYFQAS